MAIRSTVGAGERLWGPFRGSSRLVLTLATAVLACSLAACGDDEGGGDGADDQNLNSASVEELYQQAKDEGGLTIYTPLNEEAMADVAEAFNSTYPGIDVEAITLGVDDLVARVNTEQQGGKFVADVITEDGIHTSQLISVDALAPYTPQAMPDLPDGVEDVPEGYESIAFVTTRAVAYRTRRHSSRRGSSPRRRWRT